MDKTLSLAPDKALGALKAAAAAAPTNASIQYHLVLALEQTGNTGSARPTLQAILAGGQDFPERSEAEARLARIGGE